MKVIEELEVSRRGPYTGSLGWIGMDGSAALNVTIRTLCFLEDAPVTNSSEQTSLQRGGVVSYGVGGGIVYDSEPAAEWHEAMLKGQALAAALRPGAIRPRIEDERSKEQTLGAQNVGNSTSNLQPSEIIYRADH